MDFKYIFYDLHLKAAYLLFVPPITLSRFYLSARRLHHDVGGLELGCEEVRRQEAVRLPGHSRRGGRDSAQREALQKTRYKGYTLTSCTFAEYMLAWSRVENFLFVFPRAVLLCNFKLNSILDTA